MGLTRQNEEGGLMVDYFAMKIGRPLHRTLQGGKNASKENSEGRTRTGDTRLMNQGPFPPKNAFFAGNSAVSRHLSHN
jgi:hypothetical protein